jgi:(1->4)-alpha-D-glucan 1-alpha-D-glucosylmutase
MRPGFGFDEAAAIVPYLATLGVSHVYCSPYLQAAPGSTHGYDAADPSRVNDELGGPEAHGRFLEALRRGGLGQVLDIVPNHMTNKGRANRWWWDILEHGRNSRYALYFDVNWHPNDPKLAEKVLLPFLGDHYGRLLERGEITLAREGECFLVRYGDHELPVAPESLEQALESAADRMDEGLLREAARAARMPEDCDPEAAYAAAESMYAAIAKALAEEPGAAETLDAVVAEWNASPEALDRLLSRQHYRLAFWRTGSGEINYRRFFVENALVGVCVENERVFGAMHGKVLQWVREGLVEGLRIDHVDGLRDPQRYLERLREQAPQAWIVVEKILSPDERMPESWPVQGTTGYDFLNALSGLFVDPAAEKPLTDFYAEFTREPVDFDAEVREKKLLVLRTGLASEVFRLALLLLSISEKHWRYRDYTVAELRDVLSELIADFPVYRSYTRPEVNVVSDQDECCIRAAADRAMHERPDVDPQLFEFVRDLLLLRTRGVLEDDFLLRFQQLSGPAMAKGAEDTAFYTYNRLVCLNEVGGSPERFGTAQEEFHAYCAYLQSAWPETMTTTATHDTKRGEDLRARLALLSEMPEAWAEAVRRWASINQGRRENDAPSRNDEYLFYQTLVGAWPLERERAVEYMLKAAREAKTHTDWTEPNAAYEEAVAHFVEGCLEDETFCKDLEAFVQPLVEPGRVNALAQLCLKLCAPGIPDTYQGTELWDLSLVDPDNRRPVDYALRQRLLSELDGLSPEEIFDRADEGLPKLWLLQKGLDLRRRRPEAFGPDAGYTPLGAQGAHADRVVAFMRGQDVVAVATRQNLRLRENWADTSLELPPGRWLNALTREETFEGRVNMVDLFARSPVAILENQPQS